MYKIRIPYRTFSSDPVEDLAARLELGEVEFVYLSLIHI